jgi:hypothetical protein
MVMAGAIICPSTTNIVAKKANVVFTGGLRIVLVVVFVIIAFVAMPGTETGSVTPASSPQSISTEGTETVANDEPAETQVQQVKEEQKDDLELLEGTETTKDEFTKYIEGKIRNNTKHEYSYVQVTFNLYDDEGALVDSTLANVNNLEPGGIWKFKAIIMNEDATSFKLSDITGF